MTAKHTVPNKLERALAETVVDTVYRQLNLEGAAYDNPTNRAAIFDLVAGLLAEHRRRDTELALGALVGLDGGISEHALQMFDHGWTPGQVHELVSAHRKLQRQLVEARGLIPKVLAGAE